MYFYTFLPCIFHGYKNWKNPLNDAPNTEWVDDNTDVAATFGSDDFRPQTSRLNQTPAVNLEDIYPIKDNFAYNKFGMIDDYIPSFRSEASSPNREGINTSSRFTMPVQGSIEDNEDVISTVTERPAPKKRGRPKSDIPLKERGKAQYQKQKAKKAAAQL